MAYPQKGHPAVQAAPYQQAAPQEMYPQPMSGGNEASEPWQGNAQQSPQQIQVPAYGQPVYGSNEATQGNDPLLSAPGQLADDSASLQDWLGVRAMCHAVANFILNEETSPPLAIVFQGPWGKGKSTVMNLVEKSLRILPLLRTDWGLPTHTVDCKTAAWTKETLGGKDAEDFRRTWGKYLHLSKVYHDVKSAVWAATGMWLTGDPRWSCGDLLTSLPYGKDWWVEYYAHRVMLKAKNADRLENLGTLDKLLDAEVERVEQLEQGRARAASRVGCCLVLWPLWGFIQWVWLLFMWPLKKLFRRATVEELQLAALNEAANRVVLPVRFNAWLYRDTKEVWAGMAVIIGRAMESRIGAWKWWVYVKYGWEQRSRELVTSVVVPLLLAISLTLILAFSSPSIVRAFRSPSPALAPTGAEAPASEAPDTLTLILGGLGGASTVVLAVWRINAFLKPISQRIADYVTSPTTTHQANVGYQHSVISDLEFLGGFLPGVRLVVFIDDLDRCQDKAVVSVLEAVNLVLGGCDSKKLQVFTVLGLDMEMTVTAIHSFYNSQATSESLERERVTREDSRRFLQKIIQVSIDVPATTEATREVFIRRLFGETMEGPTLPLSIPEEAIEDAQASALPSNQCSVQTEGLASSPRGIDIGEAATQPDSSLSGQPFPDRRPVRISLNGDARDERGKRLMALFSDVLPDNPREIKRMFNNYRLAANVLEWAGLSGAPELNDVMRDRLVLWVVLLVTFPSLASDIAWLCRQPEKEGETRDGLEQLRDRLESNIQGKKKDLLKLVGMIASSPPGASATELVMLEKEAFALRQTLEQKIKELAHFEKFREKTFNLKGRFRTVKDFLPFRQFGAGLYLHTEREEWGQSKMQELAEEIAEAKGRVYQNSGPGGPGFLEEPAGDSGGDAAAAAAAVLAALSQGRLAAGPEDQGVPRGMAWGGAESRQSAAAASAQ